MICFLNVMPDLTLPAHCSLHISSPIVDHVYELVTEGRTVAQLLPNESQTQDLAKKETDVKYSA